MHAIEDSKRAPCAAQDERCSRSAVLGALSRALREALEGMPPSPHDVARLRECGRRLMHEERQQSGLAKASKVVLCALHGTLAVQPS